MPDGKTTRRTSGKKITVKVKPTKTKKAKKPRKKVVKKTLTSALNTYKSVKNKIFGDKETRQERRAGRKEKRIVKRETRRANRSAEEIEDIPVLQRLGQVMDDEDDAPVRTTGVGALERDIQYKINPVTRKIDYDSAIDSDLGNERDLEGVEIPGRRRKKKNNTMLYLLLALLVAFAIYKMTAKK